MIVVQKRLRTVLNHFFHGKSYYRKQHLLKKCVCRAPQGATNAKYKIIFPLKMPKATRRAFQIVPHSKKGCCTNPVQQPFVFFYSIVWLQR